MAARRQARAASALRPPSREWLRLQGSFADRCSRYLREVSELVRRRSLDPKEWVANYSELVCAVIGDVGDFTLSQSGEALRPSDEWVCRFRKRVPRTQLTTSMAIEVPQDAFGKREEITLVTDGLSRGDRAIVLEPDRHVRIMLGRSVRAATKRRGARAAPGVISRSERRSIRIRFANLPPLQPGVYSGIVCAKETDVTVAIVELEVF